MDRVEQLLAELIGAIKELAAQQAPKIPPSDDPNSNYQKCLDKCDERYLGKSEAGLAACIAGCATINKPANVAARL